MKKLIALISAAVILFSFSACGKKDYPFTFEEHTVTEGIYNYYKSAVSASPEDYAASPEDENSINEAAKRCCKEYLAAIKLMEDEKITLGSEFKRRAAENTENIWSMFSDYYNGIGVTKQDITGVQTHESRLLQLLEHFYGTSGKEPVK